MIINHDFGLLAEHSQELLGAFKMQNLGATLFVALDNFAKSTGFPPESLITMTASDFINLNPRGFTSLAPRMVVTPLFSDGLDVLDFARHLSAVGFAGRYRALVAKLPDPSLIQREVNSIAPSINFGITELAVTDINW